MNGATVYKPDCAIEAIWAYLQPCIEDVHFSVMHMLHPRVLPKFLPRVCHNS